MEHVEGESLRGLILRGKIEIKRAFELAAQVAGGLAAAHDAGIVHRDIKPENLMITRASQVKILDFGLAKLVETQRASIASREKDRASNGAGVGPETAPGVIVGTVSYMSPEQAEGRPVDHRTDIFSLGTVLYELLTGKRPFDARSAIDTLHSIINQEPRPALELNPRLPLQSVEILGKAMAKDESERYRHAGDLELDLRRLKRAIESQSVGSAGARTLVRGALDERARWPSFLSWLIPASIGALIALSVAFGVWIIRRPAPIAPPAVWPERITLTPLTTDPGFEGDPTFSPDGQTIAYTSDRTGNFQIFLKSVSGGQDINLTNSPADEVQPSFSPDGKRIAFVSSRSAHNLFYHGTDLPIQGGDIYVMPALGGSARHIVGPGNFPSWSPDGAAIIFTSGTWFQQRIYRVPAGGGERQEIHVDFKADEALPDHLLYPSYSSDGRWIAFEGVPDRVYIVDAEGGEAKLIANGRRPAWSADSQAIIYSNSEAGKNLSLWRIPFETAGGKVSGSPEPLTVSHTVDTQAAVSRDGKRIAFTAIDLSFNLEMMPFDAEAGTQAGEPRPITSGSNRFYFQSQLVDGKSVVFDSHRGASSHIWRVEIGSIPYPLTADPNFMDTYPRLSAIDGSVAFARKPSNEPQSHNSIWLMEQDGGNPRLLVENGGFFAWLPNGRGLVYQGMADRQLYLFDLVSKTPRRLTSESGVMQIMMVSPNSKWVVYQSTIADNVTLRAAPIDGGDIRVVVDSPRYNYHPSFSPSGRWLYYQPDHKNLYRVPGPAQAWRKEAPQKVTNFPESGLFLEDPQITPDGRHLTYSRGRLSADIWLMDLGK
jgi:Tol biopolymer transport system component